MLRFTDPREVLLRDKNGMRMKTSDIGDKETVDRMIKEIEKDSTAIPPPLVAISAFENGIETLKGSDPDVFNVSPLLPITGKQATRTLFDRKKIEKYLSEQNFVPYAAARVNVNEAISDDIETYIAKHVTELRLAVDHLTIKGSLVSEMKSSNSERVMYSKVQRCALMGFLQLRPSNGLVDYLSAGAKEIFDNIDSKESAIAFYETYGNFYVYEISMGACCQVTQAVKHTHRLEETHVRTGFEATLKQIVNLDATVKTEIDTGFTTIEEYLEMRSVGGDITLAGDIKAYGKSAYENPDIVSYRTAPVYKITNDPLKRNFLKEAHLEIMEKYKLFMPTIANPDNFVETKYSVEYVWVNKDMIPWTGEEIHITLKLDGKFLAKNKINGRVAAERWCQKVRVPGGSFGSEWSGQGHCTTRRPLDKSSIDVRSSDLNGLVN